MVMLGVGGQALISQSLATINRSFAFRKLELRQLGPEIEEIAYQYLHRQISVFGRSEVREHPNIIDLIGICWEIEAPEQSVVRPVFVFEKAKYGDTKHLMCTKAAVKIAFEGRLRLYANLVCGMEVLHRNCKHPGGRPLSINSLMILL
jgi:hypothetical protein